MITKAINKLLLFMIGGRNAYSINDAEKLQRKILLDIVKKNKDCLYGKKYKFNNINNYIDFKKQLPIVKYENIEELIETSMIKKESILCSEEIMYYAKTAGTSTGRSKYLPVTKSCLKRNHIKGGRSFMYQFLKNNLESKIFKGGFFILNGSFPKEESKSKVGYISAILQKESGIAGKILGRRLPERVLYNENREEKVEELSNRYKDKNITVMGGVTSWCLIILENILSQKKKENMGEIWKDFGLFISGGLNFEPYRARFKKIFPKASTKFYQVYNSSEGFFGVQNSNKKSDMQLLLNHGVFYEFIDMKTYNSEKQKVVTINSCIPGEQYALLITTYGGLYRYEIGDTIEFTDINSFMFKITGRTRSYIDVFSEHIIVDNTDNALLKACLKHNIHFTDYHVGPKLITSSGKGYHEWLIESDTHPKNIKQFIKDLDLLLKEENSYYAGKRFNDIMIQEPYVHFLKKGSFVRWLERKGKLGGQFKVTRLSNDRKILEEILLYTQKDAI